MTTETEQPEAIEAPPTLVEKDPEDQDGGPGYPSGAQERAVQITEAGRNLAAWCLGDAEPEAVLIAVRQLRIEAQQAREAGWAFEAGWTEKLAALLSDGARQAEEPALGTEEPDTEEAETEDEEPVFEES